MIKIGVVSDTHLTKADGLPDALLRGLSGVDLILHAGDITQSVILKALTKLCPEVKAVHGNMDHFSVKEALPAAQLITLGGFRIGLTHGIGSAHSIIETVKRTFKNQNLDCIVYGHSHCPYNQVHQGVLYFNSGSPTDKIFAPYNSYGILELDKKITGKIIRL